MSRGGARAVRAGNALAIVQADLVVETEASIVGRVNREWLTGDGKRKLVVSVARDLTNEQIVAELRELAEELEEGRSLSDGPRAP